LAVWKVLAMSWKTSVNDEAAKMTTSPVTGAAVAGLGAAAAVGAAGGGVTAGLGAVVGGATGAAVGLTAPGAQAARKTRVMMAENTRCAADMRGPLNVRKR
jgi:hypothetical protein